MSVLSVEDLVGAAVGVRTLTLDRVDRKNALSPELVDALRVALIAADADTNVRALVLTGAGDAFCAGGDLGGGLVGDGFFQQHEARGGFAELLSTLRRISKVTVAAVNGLALGGGFGLLLACDLAVVADDADVGTPEVKRGLFPMMISRLVYETLPRKFANELVLLGAKVRGERLLELGIANRVVPRARVLEEAVVLAASAATLSPAVLALGKRALRMQEEMPYDAAVSFLRDQLTLNLQLDDAAEGISAFLEKRPPRFVGR